MAGDKSNKHNPSMHVIVPLEMTFPSYYGDDVTHLFAIIIGNEDVLGILKKTQHLLY